MSGDELILEELQTQTEILQSINDLNIKASEDYDMLISIFPPLIFIYIVFGLFFRGK